jgi:glycosyltransferase involved in cell wall biosynthesis
MKKISLVVPAYNEEQTLMPFYQQLLDVITPISTYNWEIVLVNDGSKDRTWQLITALSTKDARIIGLNFSRNFGKELAITA